MQLNLYGTPLPELTPLVGGQGRAVEVWQALRAAEVPVGASTPLRTRLAALDTALPLQLTQRTPAVCGTQKLLLRCRDGRAVETVLIPGRGRTTVCVSSQVGCARGCGFCVTATMGLVRSLSAAEIVAQVVLAGREARAQGMPAVRNVVFMGMGEPLDNLEAVEQSLRVLTEPRCVGLAPRHITISTVGPSPRAIARAASWPGVFAWSVHAADDELRRELVPTTKHRMSELRDAFVAVTQARRQHLFIEVTLIAGKNDQREHALALAELLRPFVLPPRVNLIPMNPGREGLDASSLDAVQSYARLLLERGYRTMVRATRGVEAAAACGQLAVSA